MSPKTYLVTATFASGNTYHRRVKAVSALDAKNSAARGFAAREERLVTAATTGALSGNGIVTITATKET